MRTWMRVAIIVALLGMLALLVQAVYLRLRSPADHEQMVASLLTGVVTGLVTGLVASLSIVYWYEIATGPSLVITEDPNDPVYGAMPVPHHFYHVHVKQREAGRPFRSRRPAWATRASVTVYRSDRSDRRTLVLGPITGRWAGAPEPLAVDGRGKAVPDITKLPYGERWDIHYGHPGEQLDVAVHILGDADWYVWNSENYWHEWRHPGHRLQPGEYQVHVQAFYEAGTVDYWKPLVVPPPASPQIAWPATGKPIPIPTLPSSSVR